MRDDPSYIPFLRTIVRHPDLDGPRLVLADYMEEQGDPWAHVMRLQIEAERNESRRLEYVAALEAEKELFVEDAHRRRLIAAVAWWALCGDCDNPMSSSISDDAIRIAYRRGLIEEIGVPYSLLPEMLRQSVSPGLWNLRKIYTWDLPRGLIPNDLLRSVRSHVAMTVPNAMDVTGIPLEIVPLRHSVITGARPVRASYSQVPREVEFAENLVLVASQFDLYVRFPLYVRLQDVASLNQHGPFQVQVARRHFPPLSGIIVPTEPRRPLYMFLTNTISPQVVRFDHVAGAACYLYGDESITVKSSPTGGPLPVISDTSWWGSPSSVAQGDAPVYRIDWPSGTLPRASK